jgi:hypothetical protein
MNSKKYRNYTIKSYHKQGVSKHEIKTILNGTSTVTNEGHFTVRGIVKKNDRHPDDVKYVPLNASKTEKISIKGRNVL